MIALALVLALLQSDDVPWPPPPTPPPADCTIVGPDDASRILGFPVQPAEEAQRTGGICFFTSTSASSDGSLAYAIVTPIDLPMRRAFFRATARRCAPAVLGTLNELACRQFIALAGAQDMDAYFAGRTSASTASPVPGLGYPAVLAGNAVYVHRKNEVLELSVVIAGDIDVDRTVALAKLLLTRTK